MNRIILFLALGLAPAITQAEVYLSGERVSSGESVTFKLDWGSRDVSTATSANYIFRVNQDWQGTITIYDKLGEAPVQELPLTQHTPAFFPISVNPYSAILADPVSYVDFAPLEFLDLTYWIEMDMTMTNAEGQWAISGIPLTSAPEATVPEPATFGAVFAGLVGLAVLVRRRRV